MLALPGGRTQVVRNVWTLGKFLGDHGIPRHSLQATDEYVAAMRSAAGKIRRTEPANRGAAGGRRHRGCGQDHPTTAKRSWALCEAVRGVSAGFAGITGHPATRMPLTTVRYCFS